MEGPTNPRVTIAVTRQLNLLRNKAPDGVVSLQLNEADIFDIQAELSGPISTPYEGGVFRCKLCLPADFPKSPPKGYFITKIFHPNVSEKGEICVNTLKRDWNPNNWSFYNIFEVIKCLMIVPFPESALNEEAGKLFMENYQDYFKHAKLMTELHAHKHKDKQQQNNSNHQKQIQQAYQQSQLLQQSQETQLKHPEEELSISAFVRQRVASSERNGHQSMLGHAESISQQRQDHQIFSSPQAARNPIELQTQFSSPNSSMQQQQQPQLRQFQYQLAQYSPQPTIQQQNNTSISSGIAYTSSQPFSSQQQQQQSPRLFQVPDSTVWQTNSNSSPFRDGYNNSRQIQINNTNNTITPNNGFISANIPGILPGKNQNQENLLLQITGNNNTNFINGQTSANSLASEEPLCVLSKNNGYSQNNSLTWNNNGNITGTNTQQTQIQQKQQQQQSQIVSPQHQTLSSSQISQNQQQWNNLTQQPQNIQYNLSQYPQKQPLQLTFNTCNTTVTSQSANASKTTTAAGTNLKTPSEKQKWLKRI